MNYDLIISVNNEYQELLNLVFDNNGKFSLEMCVNNKNRIDAIKKSFLNTMSENQEIKNRSFYEKLNQCSKKTSVIITNEMFDKSQQFLSGNLDSLRRIGSNSDDSDKLLNDCVLLLRQLCNSQNGGGKKQSRKKRTQKYKRYRKKNNKSNKKNKTKNKNKFMKIGGSGLFGILEKIDGLFGRAFTPDHEMRETAGEILQFMDRRYGANPDRQTRNRAEFEFYTGVFVCLIGTVLMLVVSVYAAQDLNNITRSFM